MKPSHLLGGLALLLCASLIYAWKATPRQQKAPPKVAAQQPLAQSSGQTVNKELPQPADMAAIPTVTKPVAYAASIRDLFVPVAEKVVPPPIRAPKPVPKPAVVHFLPPPPVEKLQALPQIKILGDLDKGGERTVFLMSGKDEIFLVKQGDRFGDGLRVATIDAKQIVIIHEKTSRQMTFELGKVGNQFLSMKPSSSGRPEVDLPSMTEPTQNAKHMMPGPRPLATPSPKQNHKVGI